MSVVGPNTEIGSGPVFTIAAGERAKGEGFTAIAGSMPASPEMAGRGERPIVAP